MDETVQSEETALEQSNVPQEAPETDSTEGGFDQDTQGQSELGQAAQQEAQEHFLAGSTLDPTKLPPEMQPIFKRMQGAYTKKMQDAAALREKASVVDRFYQDRDYAFQTLAQWAAQNGYQIAPVGQLQQQQRQAQQAPAADQITEAIKAKLPPELQWMADSQAPAIQAAVQQMLAPVVQQLAQSQQAQSRQYAEREWDKLAAELSEKAPGWEQHEEDMCELLDFLTSNNMSHPRYGSKHQILYDLVTKNAAAQADVTRRMNQAVKNRPSSGVSTRNATSNFQDRIRSAKSAQDAFRLAVQAAEQASGR